MSFFSRIFGIFRKKKSESLPDLPPTSNLPPMSTPMPFNEPADTSKAKMDLIAAQMDSLRLQYDTLNERVLQIEKMVKELLDIAKSP